MKYSFSDLVDIAKLQKLMESLYLATGIPVGIIDVAGNILISVGWQDICQKYHRKNLCTESLCQESDRIVHDKVESARESYVWYKCANGLIDAAAPIVIADEHVATVFLGQFLFEAPDFEYFRRQARKYKFPEQEYLEAVAKIPIYAKERVDAVMVYFRYLAEILAELGLGRLTEKELQTKLLAKNDLEIFKVFNSTPNVAIQAYDLEGNITFWNTAAELIYGYAEHEAVGRPVSEIFGEADGNKIVDMIKEINITDTSFGPEEWNLRHKDGSIKAVYSTIFPIRFSRGTKFVCMDVDITEKKLFETELLRLDRLNLVGQMAASIGHEVRNPMTTVRGYLQMLQRKPGFSEYCEHFNIMIDELDRANGIITEFLSLAQNKSIVKKLNNLNQVINSIMPLIYADAIKNDITVDLVLGNIPDLELDEKEIRQLILNLVRNGFEATSSSGIIKIETFEEDDEVVLAVQDNGSGIPEEILGNVGTPFFTTKSQGTGLGLAVCYSIARRHQARIVIDSNSSGTIVFVRFEMKKGVEGGSYI